MKILFHYLTINLDFSDFRAAFIETLEKVVDNKYSSRRGLFVHSCYVHGHITGRQGWTCSCAEGNNVLENKVSRVCLHYTYLFWVSFK